jgi:hypothetical protein
MNARKLNLVQVSLLAATVALFAGCKYKGSSSSGNPSSSGGGAITSAEKNSFEEVTAKLDKGGNFYLYLSTEQALSKLSQAITMYSNLFTQMPAPPDMGREGIARIFEVINNVIKDSGIEHISGLGVSSIAREPGFYYNKVILHHYAGQNDGALWTAFGKEVHPLKELDLLPENTAFASYCDLDIPLIWQTIEKELKQLHLPQVDQALAQLPDRFKGGAGIALNDVLNSLGGGYGVIFTLDESKQVSLPIPTAPMQIPEPGLALFAKVKNDAIFTRIDQLAIGNPLVSKPELNGVKTITVTIPLPLPISLRPTLARVGDYLFLTSSDGLLQEIMAVQSGKKSGYKATEEFKKLSQGVPTEGNNFSLISAKFGKSLTQAMQGVMSAGGAAMGGQSKMLQDLMASNSMTMAYSVGANGAEGWEAFGNGNKSMATTAVILPAAFVGGMLAAIAIPNFVRARTTSQQNACISNLRIIDGAKGQWALENHKQNTDTPTAQDITPYMGRGPAGEFPICPQGGHYIIGTVGEKPRCSIPGHELP